MAFTLFIFALIEQSFLKVTYVYPVLSCVDLLLKLEKLFGFKQVRRLVIKELLRGLTAVGSSLANL